MDDDRSIPPEEPEAGDDAHNELGYRNVDEEAEHDEHGPQGAPSGEPPAGES
jgi:hypothetical protein